MAAPLTAAAIAKQIARALHDEYDGFEVDGTDVAGSRVKAGTVQVEGTTDDGDTLTFLVTVSEVDRY